LEKILTFIVEFLATRSIPLNPSNPNLLGDNQPSILEIPSIADSILFNYNISSISEA